MKEIFLDLDKVPFLYFSRGNILFRKNLMEFYMLDPVELVYSFEYNIISLSALVSRYLFAIQYQFKTQASFDILILTCMINYYFLDEIKA